MTVDEDAFEWMGRFADGDARRALTALEAAVSHIPFEEESLFGSPDLLLEDLFRRKVLLYDKSGEEHFNLISALHKSLRDSDVDASLYWLARMLEAGEDPLYVARRLVRFASEDVGLADPSALRARDRRRRTPSTSSACPRARSRSPRSPSPGARAEVERALHGVRRGRGRRARAPERAAAPRDPQRADEAHEGRRLRVGLPLRARPAEKTAGLSCLPDALAGPELLPPVGRGAEKELKARAEAVRALREYG